jgi:hypothetical protein
LSYGYEKINSRYQHPFGWRYGGMGFTGERLVEELDRGVRRRDHYCMPEYYREKAEIMKLTAVMDRRKCGNHGLKSWIENGSE